MQENIPAAQIILTAAAALPRKTTSQRPGLPRPNSSLGIHRDTLVIRI